MNWLKAVRGDRDLHWARPMAFLVFSCILALGVVGCGPQVFIIQQYDGPVRDSETIAILRINGGDSTRVVTLDGELADARIAEDTRLHIEMLPGRHAVRVADIAAPEAGSFRVAFDAQAGRVYRAVVASAAAKVFEVDRGSDAMLRDVTAKLAEPPPPALSDPTGIPRGLAPVIAPEPAPRPTETAPAPSATPSAAPPEGTPPAPVIDPTTPPQP
jgi:hypothetical protein